jgi:hypothetical protein
MESCAGRFARCVSIEYKSEPMGQRGVSAQMDEDEKMLAMQHLVGL